MASLARPLPLGRFIRYPKCHLESIKNIGLRFIGVRYFGKTKQEKGEMKRNNHKNGFSLVELLVVVIIIAIVAAIAIPNLLASRKAANEASAISSLRTIHSAQVTYFGTLGGNQDYCDTLIRLGPGGGFANMIDGQLAGGSKSGYDFSLSQASGIYCANAAPQTSLGANYFGVSEPGVIYKGAAALTCSSGALDHSAASPIQ